ncbi:LLM class flavin-dependent oxidoreductase [Streptomyces sp. AcH 505]|uniref:LLM class flavin-dependent oxidoreductase n=1 Tax=Streptomyces sp. AcH 505 TaxID=352211 RepID=UPI0018E296F2
MTDDIRIGVLLDTTVRGSDDDPRELIAFAVRAERLGFDSVWVNDTLLSPQIEPLTLLAALAPATERVTLGTAVLMPVLRRPLTAARALASVDLLSGGRLIAGLGAGFPGRFGRPLYDLSEVPWERRFARLDETVALWRHLWSGEPSGSFHGEFLHFDALPEPTRTYRPGGPPLWLGGASPTALARTGRDYDGWLPYPPEPAEYENGLVQIRSASSAAGRAPGAVTPALYVTVLIAEDAERGRAELAPYIKGTYGLSLEELSKIQLLLTGTPEDVTSGLRDYLAAGARHIVCRIGTTDPGKRIDQLGHIAELIPGLTLSP